MEKITPKKVFFAIGASVLLLGLGLIFKIAPETQPEPILAVVDDSVIHVTALHPTDYSDDRKLIGAAHHIFVGKVVKQIRTEESPSGLETRFLVDVVLNLKGEFSESVEINQSGGFRDGKLTIVDDGDVVRDGKYRDNLLKEGSVYLFAVRSSPTGERHLLISHNNASKLISDNSVLSNEEYRAESEKDTKVQKWISLYPQEILLDVDVQRGYTPNAFNLLPHEEKAAAQVRADVARASLEASAAGQ